MFCISTGSGKRNVNSKKKIAWCYNPQILCPTPDYFYILRINGKTEFWKQNADTCKKNSKTKCQFKHHSCSFINIFNIFSSPILGNKNLAPRSNTINSKAHYKKQLISQSNCRNIYSTKLSNHDCIQHVYKGRQKILQDNWKSNCKKRN